MNIPIANIYLKCNIFEFKAKLFKWFTLWTIEAIWCGSARVDRRAFVKPHPVAFDFV
jgi:hypothetical protein